MKTSCLKHERYSWLLVLILCGLISSAFAQQKTPRMFEHNLEYQSGSKELTVHFDSPEAFGPFVPTKRVKLSYRINNQALVTVLMNEVTFAREYEYVIANVGSADVVKFYFTQILEGVLADIPVDSSWFTYTVGQGLNPAPVYPIVTKTSGRFRDRHENEGRFDHFVSGYMEGPMFAMDITDYGDRMTILIKPALQTTRFTMIWWDHNGKKQFCDRAEYSGGAIILADGTNTYNFEVPGHMITGQFFDFEFVVTRADNQVTYYTEIFRYRIGEGKFTPIYQHPWAFAADEGSVSIVTDNTFAFSQHLTNIQPNDLSEFLEGKVLFDTDWQNNTLNNPQTALDCNGLNSLNVVPSPVFDGALLGPTFNQNSCFACHVNDGRGRPPTKFEETMDTMLFRLSVPGVGPKGGPKPHPTYGTQLQDKDLDGGTAEGVAKISYEEINGTFNDGTPYTLTRPIYTFENLISDPIDGTDIMYSPRVAPVVFGLGLLEAVEDETILEYADENDADGDGISGKPNSVWDYTRNEFRLGRYGWKASQPTIRQQTASAAFNDLGIGNSVFNHNGQIEFTDHQLDMVTQYLRQLSPPPRGNWKDPMAIRGKTHFKEANCIACHRPHMETGNAHPIAALRNQTIQPFTDMLLHDMGPELADGRNEYSANGREWRTPPLWGLGLVEEVNKHTRYLHDGRARSIMEAILWHGGEAEASKQAVLALSETEREELIAYVKYPFVDPDSEDIFAGEGDPWLPGEIVTEGDLEPGTTCHPYITQLNNEHVRFSITLPEQKKEVKIYASKNDAQNLSGAPAEEVINPDGTVTYRYTLMAFNYNYGDVLAARFSYKEIDDTEVFVPGPNYLDWSEKFLYGPGCDHELILDPEPLARHPYIRQLPNGDIEFRVTLREYRRPVNLYGKINGQFFSYDVSKVPVENKDTSYTYTHVMDASHFKTGDVIEARYWTSRAGQVFVPGPNAETFCEPFIYDSTGSDDDL